MPDLSIALWSAALVFGSLTVLWLISLPIKNSSIVDIYWGLGFVLVAWISFVLGQGPLEQRALVAGLTTLWGLRLSAYLAWRNLGHGEDKRYAAMRKKAGVSWPLRSLFVVFWLQGALLLLISLPLQLACTLESKWTWLEYLGALIVLFGVTFETIGDVQLARFKAKNTGQVMQTGLWRYTRHPNYFGDFCTWWGLWLLAASTLIGAWTILSPFLMSFLLMRVSGVPMLERSMKSRPGYDEYIKRTSSFFPRAPRQPSRSA